MADSTTAAPPRCIQEFTCAPPMGQHLSWCPMGTLPAEPQTGTRLREAAQQLLDSLLAVEWGSFTTDAIGDEVEACPNCFAPMGDAEIEGSGLHTPTCELRDSLDAALGVTSPRAEVSHG